MFLLQSLNKDSTAQSQLRPLYLTFIDVRMAFDSVSRDSILLSAERLEIPEHLIAYLRCFYTGATTRFRVGGKESSPIVIGRGVRQGDPLSPFLFNAVMDWVLTDLDPENIRNLIFESISV